MSRPKIGYAAMLEQFHPTELLEMCAAAEAAGFDGIMAADHVQPWVPQQGQAAHVWTFMTAAMERTRGDVGPGVTCPSFRQHPAMIAQAAATMAAMYPGRFWLGLGSGEALNEHIVAEYWPEAPERISRMFEAIEIIRKLFSGKDVKHKGEYYRMETMRLWTMPATTPLIYVATAGPITAKKVGALADGIITVGAPEGRVQTLMEKCFEGCVEAGKDPAKFKSILQLHLSWAATDEEAMANAIARVAQRGHALPQAGHPLAARPRADGPTRASRGLPGPYAHQLRPRSAPAGDPALPGCGFRRDLPPQRRSQSARMGGGLRP